MKIAPWSITWGERVWTDESVTVAHASLASMILGEITWEACNPWASHVHLAAWVAALVACDSGRDVEEVVAEVGRSPLAALVAALDVREG